MNSKAAFSWERLRSIPAELLPAMPDWKPWRRTLNKRASASLPARPSFNSREAHQNSKRPAEAFTTQKVYRGAAAAEEGLDSRSNLTKNPNVRSHLVQRSEERRVGKEGRS